jgi:hypothetical protein
MHHRDQMGLLVRDGLVPVRSPLNAGHPSPRVDAQRAKLLIKIYFHTLLADSTKRCR